MVESSIARLLLDGSLVLLIVASILEVAIDIGDISAPEFLPAPLAGLPSSHPATGLALLGILVAIAGVGIEMSASSKLPGGRLLIGIIAVIAFLFAGGYVVGGNEAES